MANKTVAASPGAMPTNSWDPLGGGLGTATIATFDWSTASPIRFDFRLSGLSGVGNFTAPAIAVVQYYDPFTNAIVRDFKYVGGGTSATDFSIVTGGSVDGSVQGSGQVKIAVYNLAGADITFVPKWMGLGGKLIGIANDVMKAINGTITNPHFMISDMGGAVVDPSDPRVVDSVMRTVDRVIIQQVGPPPPNCFAADTLIQMADGTARAISDVRPGDFVSAFDASQDLGRSLLSSARVTRIFTNVADEWLILSACESGKIADITVTAGHEFLSTSGEFRRIDEILKGDSTVVLADGSTVSVTAKRIAYASETAHLYEQTTVVECVSVGGLALAPAVKSGWKTYNFEVEGLHTYIAGGVRVHNDSIITLAIESNQFSTLYDRAFNGSQEDFDRLLTSISKGEIASEGAFVDASSNDRFWAPFASNFGDRTVVSIDSNGVASSTVVNNFLQHTTSLPIDGSRIDTLFRPDGGRNVTTTDLADQFDWSREFKRIHPDGLFDQVTVGDDGNVSRLVSGGDTFIGGEIGAILGSNLGRLLGSNTIGGKIAAGTVIGAVGREIGHALENGVTFSLEHMVGDAFGSLGGGIGSFPSAGIGMLSSLLMGELAERLNIHGVGGAVFQSVGSTVTTKLVTNVYGMATAAVVPGTGLPYQLSTGFDAGSIGFQIESAIASYFGGQLGAKVLAPRYEEGALGGSIGSAIGSAIGTLIAGPVGAFIGSFLGQVTGTGVGDQIGNDPEVNGQLWFNPFSARYERLPFHTSHGGDATAFIWIAQHQANVLNALIDTSGAQVAYTMPELGFDLTQSWNEVPRLKYTQDDTDFKIKRNNEADFVVLSNVSGPGDLAPMVDSGIMKLVDGIDLTGGDPLVRWVWDHSTANNSTAFEIDLKAARDYRTYLNDWQAINALMAAAPESAFTTGWALTLMKARDLGIDQLEPRPWNSAPVLTVSNVTARISQTLAAASLFGARDADGDALGYWFRDDTVGNGHFEVNGVAQPAGLWISLAAAQLGGLTFRTAAGGADQVRIQVSDERSVSGEKSFLVRAGAPDHDFNGDGTSDILWQHAGGQVSIWAMNNGSHAGGSVVGTPDLNVQLKGDGDFNGDFTSDILLYRDTDGAAGIWIMNNGSFAGGGLVGTLDPGVEVKGTGDFNGDGTDDILLYRASDRAVGIWSINNGSFAGGGIVSTLDPGVEIKGTGDFNGDGTDDVLLYRAGDRAAGIWLMNNAHFAGGGLIGTFDPGVEIKGTGDFNGNGTDDILLYRAGDRAVGTWLMNNGSFAGGGIVGALDPGVEIKRTGDFNGNGTDDILLYRAGDGAAGIWAMNNGVFAGGGIVGALDPNLWHL